jgi:hypothetical protein
VKDKSVNATTKSVKNKHDGGDEEEDLILKRATEAYMNIDRHSQEVCTILSPLTFAGVGDPFCRTRRC